MPEDFKEFWYNPTIFNKHIDIGWQEQADYDSTESDRDLFAMYCMMSV